MKPPSQKQLKALHDLKNRLGYWYPTVMKLGIPNPETIIVPLDRWAGMAWMEGEKPLPTAFKDQYQEACDRLGYPVFVRTDEASGKHDWRDSCYVENARSDIWRHLQRVIEFNEMADIMGLNYSAICVRRYVKPASLFTAWRGMPVGREYRFFARDGKLECFHPYWFEDAIAKDYNSHQPPLPKDWKAKLAELYLDTPPGSLAVWAEDVTKALGGYWSVDFLYADKKWWLTDMALGDASYHMKHEDEAVRLKNFTPTHLSIEKEPAPEKGVFEIDTKSIRLVRPKNEPYREHSLGQLRDDPRGNEQ
jgi:hypothetical protein